VSTQIFLNSLIASCNLRLHSHIESPCI